MRLPRASSLLVPTNRKDTRCRETLSDVVPTKEKWQWLGRRPPPRTFSAHLVDPAQTVLFEARRDWSCLAAGELDHLPALTPAAEALVTELDQQARARRWSDASRNNATKTLRILLAWIGADAPIHEADIRALNGRRATTVRRVLQFLNERAMVIPDPARQGSAVQRAIQQRIHTLPNHIAGEVQQWVKVARGQGRREHQELPFATIRSHLNSSYPVLVAWSEHNTSLREITRDHVQAALDERPPATARNLLPALRSLFRALKQERIIFRDPTRGITLSAMRRLPAPIPTDQLRGLIDRAQTPMAKLIVALIAIHGLRNQEARHLLLADLDLPTGRLLVRRNTSGHTVYLDELTHTLAADWLRQRHDRWPLTTNAHLLISRVTAADTTNPPIAHTLTDAIFKKLGLTATKLSQHRILDKAKHTADPVHLMLVFGLTAKPAMHYVQTAHPERRSK